MSPRTGCSTLVRELGIGFVAYSPLSRGFLTGAISSFEDFAPNDYRRNSPRFMGENFQRNLDLVQRVTELAREHNCTPAQLALAWVLHQGSDIVPIPGTKRRRYLEENLEACEIVLSAEDLRADRRGLPAAGRSSATGTRTCPRSTADSPQVRRLDGIPLTKPQAE